MGFFDKVKDLLTRSDSERSSNDTHKDDARKDDARKDDARKDAEDRTSVEVVPRAGEPQATVPQATEPQARESRPGEQPGAGEAPAAPDLADEDVAAAPRHRTVTVQPDETFEEVARRCGADPRALAELNGVDPDLIFAGQVFKVPHV